MTFTLRRTTLGGVLALGAALCLAGDADAQWGRPATVYGVPTGGVTVHGGIAFATPRGYAYTRSFIQPRAVYRSPGLSVQRSYLPTRVYTVPTRVYPVPVIGSPKLRTSRKSSLPTPRRFGGLPGNWLYSNSYYRR